LLAARQSPGRAPGSHSRRAASQKIGLLYPGPEATAAGRGLLVLEGLRREGFRAPDQVMLVSRATGGDPARLAPLAAELIASNVDIILPVGSPAVRVARTATSSIPIVTYDLESDPIESGWLASLAHPGGNITGIFLDLPEISTALLELLKLAVPHLVSIVVLWDPSRTAMAQHKAVLAAALTPALPAMHLRGVPARR
jgi:putative tryptophan/tyrosine transport system substrate-binding protein